MRVSPPTPPPPLAPLPEAVSVLPLCKEEWDSLTARGSLEGESWQPVSPLLKACFEVEKLGVC